MSNAYDLSATTDVLDHERIPRRSPESCTPRMPDMWQHWEHSLHTLHPLQRPPCLEPGFQQCLDIQDLIGGSPNRMRQEIVSKIEDMVQDNLDSTQAWWASLPTHIAGVYWGPERQVSQIPVFLRLLEMFDMPGLSDLATRFRRHRNHETGCRMAAKNG